MGGLEVEWMDEWIEGLVTEQMNGWLNTFIWINEQMDDWSEWMYE